MMGTPWLSGPPSGTRERSGKLSHPCQGWEKSSDEADADQRLLDGEHTGAQEQVGPRKTGKMTSTRGEDAWQELRVEFSA